MIFNYLKTKIYYWPLIQCVRHASQISSVTIKPGKILGQHIICADGFTYDVFRGIPYATPPIGELRFQDPVPLKYFSRGTLECFEDGYMSCQKDPFKNKINGSENCLFLNVYTPKLKAGHPFSVMVWIHGGAFSMGSGNSDFFLPEYLIRENVIVVTLNYRLNMFGFLHLPSAGIMGNAGLKDQLLAIKWVKENIEEFNGDPNNITLFGQSAGAASIHLHLLSEHSKKYFSKAICQSGNSLMEWVVQKNSNEKARNLAKLLGCTEKKDRDIARFLKNIEDPFYIYKHILNTLSKDERRRGLPIPFKPVIEGDINDAIVKRSPLEQMLQPNSIDKPVMMGYTSSEGITMIANAIRKIENIDKDLAQMIPCSLDVPPDDPICLQLANEIRKFYFKGNAITAKKIENLTFLMSDYHFGIGMHLVAEIHASYNHQSPLYFYRFSYDGNLNFYKKLFDLNQIPGVCHGDELLYLFKTRYLRKNFRRTPNDESMIRTMCHMWTNFAKYGNPTPMDNNQVDFIWKPVQNTNKETPFSLNYLEIDTISKMQTDPDMTRIDFWRKLFTIYNGGFLKPKL